MYRVALYLLRATRLVGFVVYPILVDLCYIASILFSFCVLFFLVCLGCLRMCLLWVFLTVGPCVWLGMFPVCVFVILPWKLQ